MLEDGGIRSSFHPTVLETAINGQADVLVTFNVRDYAKAPQSFGMEVLRPVDTLRRIRA